MLPPAADLDFSRARRRLGELDAVRVSGRVTDVIGLVVEASGPGAPVGSLCRISTRDQGGIFAEVVGFRTGRVLLMPLGDLAGVAPGSQVLLVRERPLVGVGDAFRGRIVDGLGRPLDGRGPIEHDAVYPLYGDRMNPLDRRPIREPLDLGIRAVNALLTCGRGQRLGIFAGAGLEHSVVVAATSDQPPLVRLHGAFLAVALAEHFRDQGRDVLLMMDSLTRVAMAQREVGLSVGEPPSTRGYTPSVFALLPRLLERAGQGPEGSITRLYTVLVEGDDLNEPVADAARSLLDGHVILSRRLASEGHYPAVDVLASLSRTMIDVVGPDQQAQAGRVRAWLATHREAEDLIQIGAYARGSSQAIDEAIAWRPLIAAFLRQPLDQRASFEESVAALAGLAG